VKLRSGNLSWIRAAGVKAALLACALLPISASDGSYTLLSTSSATIRIPSLIAWTPETITAAGSGDAFRGLLLARRCNHCHGQEGFSAEGAIPNLASLSRLSIWKQLRDFRDGKRHSAVMEPIAATLSTQDMADAAAYYSMLPVMPDPQDNRTFPEASAKNESLANATLLVSLGDGTRGIPPCQACHGPAGVVNAAPSLATQNAEYVLEQLNAFANGSRTNDINMPMRTVARLLTEDERHKLADFYGSGTGQLPMGVP